MYLFLFSVWMFHSIPAVRAATTLGDLLLFPARTIFELLGGDQTNPFFVPTAFAGTNGLILGILFYCVFRVILNSRETVKSGRPGPSPTPHQEAKVS